ncbi:hypothetical protein LCI18_013065 [Fusarium solani-melongenae]|uniref:Uncharacterized protein n=1 Tax=Fusarium solani subsp. cucurbitae TaxID=2747967 RepID=A0ACD3ZM18_FUSSC|nr:hypothetical protein LCI18_013065 [Fusarium solani-melongenae]
MSADSGQFKPVPEKQAQDLPGTEQAMKPKSEPTKLQRKDQFHEYRAANKLGGTCSRAVKKHVDEFGKIHVLVNNASKQIMCSDFKDINLDDVESTFRSNILQMFAITKHALPDMEAGGSIINSASTVAFRGEASMVNYASTKGAITSFTQSLAKQLISKGIRVNAVAPGPVHTPLQPASRPAEQMEGFGRDSELGRPGQPSEIAPSFVFLASKDAELYNGQVLHAYPLGD